MTGPALRCIELRTEDRVGWLAFNRAPVNAFDWTMLEEVPAALGRLLDDDEVRVVVFASALERYFSAGADLDLFRSFGAEEMRRWVVLCHRIVRMMRGSPKPLLAAIHGVAVGGGLEMTLHCDLRFAAADARLGQPEIDIAFIPPVGGTQALARLLGRAGALRLLYEGRLLAASEAQAAGLVDVVSPPERLRADVQDYAAALASKPAGALAAIRRCVVEGGASSFEEGLAIELEAAVELAGAADFRARIERFIARRTKPRQTGGE